MATRLSSDTGAPKIYTIFTPSSPRETRGNIVGTIHLRSPEEPKDVAEALESAVQGLQAAHAMQKEVLDQGLSRLETQVTALENSSSNTSHWKKVAIAAATTGITAAVALWAYYGTITRR